MEYNYIKNNFNIMCYSGNCRWEDYMGDCRFPDTARKINYKYYKTKCLSGIDDINLYNEIESEIINKIKIKKRKEKINKIKSKLLTHII